MHQLNYYKNTYTIDTISRYLCIIDLYKMKEWLKQYWWIIVLVFILLLSIIVIFSCNQEQISRFERLGELLSKLITPVCVVLGLILGYQLLKRKLLDGYISKQFEIIYNANRKVRNQCLQLREKYSPKMNSHDLTRDDLIEALKYHCLML